MKTVFLSQQSLTIAYEESGEGLPLVWLHAFPMDRAMWRPQLASLPPNVRGIAIDLPGFGDSPVSREPAGIDALADIVADVLTALGLETPVVGGLSMGGYIAMAFARRHPQRLRGLILADTKADPDDDAAKANREKTIALAREKGAAGVIESMLPKVLSAETHEKRPEVVETVRMLGSRQSVEAITAALAALRDRPDAFPGLKNVAVPTLVIVGEHDAVTPPAAARKIQAGIPGATLVTIAGAGHLSNLENPEAFNTAVNEFLATFS